MNHFVYVTRKEASPYKKKIIDMTNEVQRSLREKFTFSYYFVGSSARNMITYDIKTNRGFDFDINYGINDSNEMYSPKELYSKIYIQLDRIKSKYGYNKIEKSTRVITLKKVDPITSKVIHSVDIAVVNDYKSKGLDCQQYIRFNKRDNSYIWQKQPSPYNFDKKVKCIKRVGMWNEVFNLYLKKKNNNTNNKKKSRAIYAETINEVEMQLIKKC